MPRSSHPTNGGPSPARTCPFHLPKRGAGPGVSSLRSNLVVLLMLLMVGGVTFINGRFGAIAILLGAGLVGLGLIVRGQRRASTLLRQSEERGRAIIDTAPDAVVTMDSAGLITGWNPQAEILFGWTRQEAIGRRMSETIIPHQYRDAHDRGVKHFLASGEGPVLNQRIEITALRRDGSDFPIELSITPLQVGESVSFAAFIRDIGVRQTADLSLRDSEEKFRQLADNITDAFWIRSPDLREVHYVSPAFERIWGRSVQCLYANPLQWADFIFPEDRERVLGVFAALATGEAPSLDLEYRIVRPAGEVRWVHVRGFQVRNAAQETIRLTGVVTDVTERKRTEAELERTRGQFSGLVNSMDGIVWEADAATFQFTFVSDRAEHILGFPPAQWLSTPDFWANQIHPADRQEAVRYCASCTRKQEDHTFEYRMLAADGRVVWVRDIVTYVEEPGKPAVLRGIMLDITARKQSEESLRASQANMAAAQRIAHFGSWELDLVQSDDAATQALRWSDEMFRIAGYEPGAVEVSKQLFFRLVHPEDRALVRQSVATALREHQEYSVVHRLIRPDGHARVVQETAQIFYDEQTGRPLKIVGTAHDITERKLAEAELEKAHQELVATSRRAGMAEAATGVLHNVGNVLNSVNVASSCLADSLKKSKVVNLSKVVALLREHETDLGAFLTLDPKGKQVPAYLGQLAEHLAVEQAAALKELAELQKNIEHIKEVVSEQQRCAKGGGKLETLRVTDLVEDTLRMDSSGHAHDDVLVLTEFEAAPVITVEKHKVLQILMNLVRNGKQSCHEAGRADKRLTLRVTNGDDRVRIAVSDNGVGISPENLAHIFAHGFTTKQDGHGFGLHSGTLAARELGGSLTAQSDGAGRGAIFTLELPLKP